MPQVFKVGEYIVYFWSGEGEPLEPVHVHVAPGKPSPNGTKVWITSAGRAMLCSNRSDIPFADLRKLMRIIEANADLILSKWQEYFGEMKFYC